MKKEQEDKTSKKMKYFYFSLIIVLLLIGVSFAFFSANFIGSSEQKLIINGLVFKYLEGDQGISLENAKPMSDNDGKTSSNYFDFNIYIENDYNYAITYNIYLKELINNDLDPKYVTVYLTDQDDNEIIPPTIVSNIKRYPNDDNSYLLYTTIIEPLSTGNNTQYYRLRMWLNDNYEDEVNYETNDNVQTGIVLDKKFGFRVNVDNLTYEDDNEKPVIISATPTIGTSSVKKQIFVTASDNIGIAGYLIKENNEMPSLNDKNWQTSYSDSYASDSIYTNGIYYVFAKDGNGNISNPYEVTITGVDISIPVCTFTGPDVNNISSGDIAYFVLTCVDNDFGEWQDSDITASDIIVSNSNIVQIGEPTKEELIDRFGYKYTFPVTARSVNGTTTLKAKKNIVLDYSGNGNKTSAESNSLTVYNLTTLKGAVVINDGANYTTSTSVSLQIKATNVTNMCVSLSGNKDTDCSVGSSNWESYKTSKTYTLSDTDGLKTVYVYFDNDSVGSDNITLDKTSPTCTIIQEKEQIYTSSKLITINATDEVSGVNNNGYSFDGTTYSSVMSKLIESNGTYSAYVKDNAGNIGQCTVVVNKIDNISPVISTASYTEVSGKLYLSYTASDDLSGLSGYYVSLTNDTPNGSSSGWVDATETNVITNVLYDSTKAYYIFVKDNVGNVSAYYLVGRDTIAPTCVITATPEGIASMKTLTITSSDTDLADTPYSFDGTTYQTGNTKDISANGVYTGYVIDTSSNVGTCSITVIGIDTESPTVVATKTGGNNTATISAEITDDTGVVGYAIMDSATTPTEWTSISSTPKTTATFTKTSTGTYYIYAIDANGNVGYTTVTLSLSRNSNCSCQSYKQSCTETCTQGSCKTYDSCAACGCSSYGSYTTTSTYCSSTKPNSSSCNTYGCYRTSCTQDTTGTHCSSSSPYYCSDQTAYCQAYKSCSSCSCLEYNETCTETCRDTSTCETYSKCWLS